MKKKSISAIALIKQDHRAVEKMYRSYKTVEGKRDERDRIAKEICDSLEMHAKMEEKHFYPAFQEGATAKGNLLIVEAYAEHLGMKALLKTVRTMSEGRGRTTMMDALMRVVKHHVKEEEDELLPMAEKELSEARLLDLGAKMVSLSPSERQKV